MMRQQGMMIRLPLMTTLTPTKTKFLAKYSVTRSKAKTKVEKENNKSIQTETMIRKMILTVLK